MHCTSLGFPAVMVLASCLWIPSAAAGETEPVWLPTLGGEPGVNSQVQALLSFDDGSGPAVFVAGIIKSAGGDPTKTSLVKWDGSEWHSLGEGLTGWVFAMTVYDDGSGPALYAGGSMLVNNQSAHVARWNGSTWSIVGGGITGGWVRALIVHDDGQQSVLYAAGDFDSAGGSPALNVARWDGASWSPLGEGVGGNVEALTVYDAGNGAELYAGGSFTTAGTSAALNIARWNGVDWFPVGHGMNDSVHALTVYDPGDGASLYAGGRFNQAGGVHAVRVAKWNGTSWSPVAGGLGNEVWTLSVLDVGTGPALYAGGDFHHKVRKLQGNLWATLGPEAIGGTVLALAAHEPGGGSPAQLFVGGKFGKSSILSWSAGPQPWSALGTGLDGLVGALLPFDDGTGQQLILAGDFTPGGNIQAPQIGAWNGEAFSPLGSGPGPNAVAALATFDDGSGPGLFAGGGFTFVGGTSAQRIAKWDGTAWSPLGSGVNADVNALTVFDDGTGPALYAGGLFTLAGGVPASRIAKWDGASWTPLSGGIVSSFSGYGVLALAVWDDGSGPALFAGGNFLSADGIPTAHIAKWDGVAWSSVGGGMSHAVWCLAVHDDGTGAALYAGGAFTEAGGVPVGYVAKWDGTAWSALSGGMDKAVFALTSHDDGFVTRLYAGGAFTAAGGSPAASLASWDGASWSPVGSGLSDSVLALRSFTLDGRVSLMVGGTFTTAPGSGDSYLAQWGFDPALPIVYCTAKTSSAGCSAMIGTSPELAQPTSGASGYAVTAMQVQGLKTGLLFAGASGPTATPFSGGTLCLQPPLKRGPLASSGGDNPNGCDGSYETVVNDGVVLPFGLDAGAGNSAWYQYWYRDPLSGAGALGSALSDAIQLDFQ